MHDLHLKEGNAKKKKGKKKMKYMNGGIPDIEERM